MIETKSKTSEQNETRQPAPESDQDSVEKQWDLSSFTGSESTLYGNRKPKTGLGKRVVKTFDYAMGRVAAGLFNSIHALVKNRPRPSFTPKWSDKPIVKSWEKSKPPLGFPRQTDSLCPQCVIDAREAILKGEIDYTVLINEKVGEIKATIMERDGQIWMVKECPEHGRVEDLMAVDADFLKWIEGNFPGRDVRAHNDEKLHNHGSSTIKYGRGSVLTVDMTNRCNMMCDPCFMDANQVGFVHELEWEEVKEVLDNSMAIKPRRQLSVQFSGGEPTMSPHFIKAIKYSRDLGFNSVQCATNGIRFAQSLEYAKEAAKAGLRYAYLQFDGIGEDANEHRKVGNLFDVKLKAIDNLYEAGVSIILVITVVNGVNNDQVGPIIRFALDNPKKIAFLAFQPVSFTGRDEAVTDERRLRQRYTLNHLALDVKGQIGGSEPTRDWFPISAFNSFTDYADMVHGPQAEWGQVGCSCHPNCGVGTAFMIDKHTGEFAPVPKFVNVPGLLGDIQKITDSARGKLFSNLMGGLALLKNYRPFSAPSNLTLLEILKKFDKTFGLSGRDYGSLEYKDVWKRRADRWNFLFVAGMWFQDLFNYDFRRTEMCIIPYGTQLGEISFCAYNTGHGWRNIIEKMFQTASTAEWQKQHGRQKIYAAGRNVEMDDKSHSLNVNQEDAMRVKVRVDDRPLTATEEKRARLKTEKENREREAVPVGAGISPSVNPLPVEDQEEAV